MEDGPDGRSHVRAKVVGNVVDAGSGSGEDDDMRGYGPSSEELGPVVGPVVVGTVIDDGSYLRPSEVELDAKPSSGLVVEVDGLRAER
jgi:hypothetical protein